MFEEEKETIKATLLQEHNTTLSSLLFRVSCLLQRRRSSVYIHFVLGVYMHNASPLSYAVPASRPWSGSSRINSECSFLDTNTLLFFLSFQLCSFALSVKAVPAIQRAIHSYTLERLQGQPRHSHYTPHPSCTSKATGTPACLCLSICLAIYRCLSVYLGLAVYPPRS